MEFKVGDKVKYTSPDGYKADGEVVRIASNGDPIVAVEGVPIDLLCMPDQLELIK